MEHETEQQIQFYRNQNYVETSLLRKKNIICGSIFTAEDRNIFYRKPSPRGIKWMRPYEIVKKNFSPKKAEFLVDGASANDLGQGYLGNCW